MSFITDIFKGGTSGILDGLGSIISKFVTDPTQKDALSTEIQKAIMDQQNLNISNAEKEFDEQINDIANARALQIASLSQTDSVAKRYIYWLATAIIVLTIAFDACLLFINIPSSDHDAIMLITGSLNTGGFAAVVSFFFGSSSGSQSKDKVIGDALKSSRNS